MLSVKQQRRMDADSIITNPTSVPVGRMGHCYDNCVKLCTVYRLKCQHQTTGVESLHHHTMMSLNWSVKNTQMAVATFHP